APLAPAARSDGHRPRALRPALARLRLAPRSLGSIKITALVVSCCSVYEALRSTRVNDAERRGARPMQNGKCKMQCAEFVVLLVSKLCCRDEGSRASKRGVT